MNIYFIHIIIAYIIDLVIGDPKYLYHPVRLIGHLIIFLERILRRIIKKDDGRTKRLFGGILAFTVIIIVFAFTVSILSMAKAINPLLYSILNIYIIYTSFAARCLGHESMKVYRTLKKGELEEARKMLSMLVGRQTSELDEKEVIRALIETTSENTLDGVISPLIFAIAGAFIGMPAPVVYIFKAVSTLDSMVGYKNEKYIDFGRVSAKLDDFLNYIPARLSGLIIPVAAFLCGKNGLSAFKIMLRDRRNHESPNSAYPEASFAGALGIRLGGRSVYFGKIVNKPFIGDRTRTIELSDIKDATLIMYVSSLITLAAGLLISGGVL